jgi:hypothetical protein
VSLKRKQVVFTSECYHIVISMELRSLAEQIIFTTVRIEAHGDSSSKVGTAFAFIYKNNNIDYSFLVTNKHVVRDSKKTTITVTEKDGTAPILGRVHRIDIPVDKWYGHPDPDIDIAVTPLEPIESGFRNKSVSLAIVTIGLSEVPTNEDLAELDAIEDLIFIGYPKGLWDSVNYLPIVRKGMTATPITIDYNGKKQFLVDGSVFKGSSGSPVFIYRSSAYYNRSGTCTVGGKRLLFLGVIADTLSIPFSKSKDRQYLDLGVVVKSSAVIEAIIAYLKSNGEL